MALISKKFEGLENDVLHYVRVFPINAEGYAQSETGGQVANATPRFPDEPSNYSLIDTYTTATTFTAPEDGWYKIEVLGASGGGSMGVRGRYGDIDMSTGKEPPFAVATGNGGGGGAYAASLVKLKKGDKVTIKAGAVGSDTVAEIFSTLENYNTIVATSGGNAVAPQRDDYETNPMNVLQNSAGVGGTASGGNLLNANGQDGETGYIEWTERSTHANVTNKGGAGGQPGNIAGNAGGDGGAAEFYNNYASNINFLTPGAGKAGFVKIYRGNTNKVA